MAIVDSSFFKDKSLDRPVPISKGESGATLVEIALVATLSVIGILTDYGSLMSN